MATFSWSDAFHAALDPCLSCIRTPPSEPSQGQGRRYSDLERLLAGDSTTSLEHDVDALSLHSNVGRGGPRRKKSVFPKSVTLFGYHLFGRPPIQLPEDDSLSPPEPTRPRPQANRIVSGQSLDGAIPDAAPLDADAINARATEEAERAARKARRREKRERKRAELALAMAAGAQEGAEAFEGFQGSGPAPFAHTYSDGTSSASGSGSGYVRVHAPAQSEHYADDADGDMGDFDALAYSRRAPRGSSAGGSDSRSRTSQSLSQSGPLSPAIASYNHQALSASNLNTHSMPPSPLSPHYDPGATPRQKKHKKTKSSRTGSSKKSGSSAASFSVPSPSTEGFAGIHEPAVASNEGQAFEGFPDDLQELPTAHAIATFPDAQGQLPSPGLASPATAFPSTGLGGRRSGKSDLGAFLASR